jgi:hypothetical protein
MRRVLRNWKTGLRVCCLGVWAGPTSGRDSALGGWFWGLAGCRGETDIVTRTCTLLTPSTICTSLFGRPSEGPRLWPITRRDRGRTDTCCGRGSFPFTSSSYKSMFYICGDRPMESSLRSTPVNSRRHRWSLFGGTHKLRGACFGAVLAFK